MASVLVTISGNLIRGLLAVFTIVVLVLGQSVFWTGAVSVWMRAVVVAVALIAYFRPQHGLLLLAAIVPLGQVGSRTLDSNMRGAEALVLGFLAGILVRAWTLREFRSFPSSRLETASLAFGLIVAASCAEQVWLSQVRTLPPWPFVQSVMTYAYQDYLASPRDVGGIFNAMLLLEGMALMACALSYARPSETFTRRMSIALVLGALIPTSLTLQQVASDLIQTSGWHGRLLDVVGQRRWSPHIGDVNAAGSFFAMGMCIAFGMAFVKQGSRTAWALAGFALALATVMTRSRTAIIAVVLVGLCVAAAATIGRIVGVRTAVAAAAVASVGSAVTLWHYLPRAFFGTGASDAVEVRWLFLGTTWRMLQSNPLFGVGVGQYASWSTHYSAPEMFRYYVRENAHNNFAQIAGELGWVGAIAFVAVLALALRFRRGAPASRHPATLPLVVGVATFMFTWLGGHPLLVPEVAYPFWMALGCVAAALVPGASSRDTSRGTSGVIIMAILGILIVSLPFRVHSKALNLRGALWGATSIHPSPVQP